jgi:tRNA(Ile2)-agmatinylcytidine synthase
VWIGIDDTDSKKGMCTTYLATEVIKAIQKKGYNIIGYPRLVRLNPNVPWKTRGNGAIAFQYGIGRGKRKKIGNIDSNIYAFSTKKYDENTDDIKEEVDLIVSSLAEMECSNTHPGVVFFKNKPPYYLYKKAVTEILSLTEVKNVITKMADSYLSYKKGRGLIGATAAVAWRPFDRTYEVLTYRNGGERWVDEESVRKMDRKCPKTFDNYDYKNRHIQIMPNSPCPILYGIRGDATEELNTAKKMVISSTIKRWLLFETNQGTDEHIQNKNIGEIKPYESIMVKGAVCKKPKTIKGGHVIFAIKNRKITECVAYEPTKGFRNVIKKLVEGDVIIVYGGVRNSPITVNIEKIKVCKLVDIYKKKGNPVCKRCKKNMKSIGKEKGYRCKRCGARIAEKDVLIEKKEREIVEGWYEVPVVARRHLAKPLKRMYKII